MKLRMNSKWISALVFIVIFSAQTQTAQAQGSSQDSRQDSRQDAGQFDSPNLRFEDRLHKVFEKYNSEPVGDSKWQSLLGQRRSETYQIQTGDTLWDISETFFGDPNYWPKLWSENSKIENPHQILPRRKLKFLAGTELDSPSFSLVAPGEEDLPSAPAYVSADSEGDDSSIDADEPRVIGGKPVIPPQLHASKPTLRDLPDSFVLPSAPKIESFDSTGLDAHETNTLKDVSGEQILSSYFAKTLPRQIGKVDDIEITELTAGTQQGVFVKLNRTANIGDHFSVFQVDGPLVGVPRENGSVIEVEGELEIMEVLSTDEQIYRAVVNRGVNPVRKGAIISSQPLPKVSFNLNGPHSSVEAKVVGGEYDRERKLMGAGGVVFLDKGSVEGLKVGDILGVEQVRKTVRGDSPFPNVRTTVGIVKIAEVEQNYSTAVILVSEQDIHPGDFTSGRVPASHRSDGPPVKKVLDIDEAGVRER